jgi:hypothetical protein
MFGVCPTISRNILMQQFSVNVVTGIEIVRIGGNFSIRDNFSVF